MKKKLVYSRLQIALLLIITACFFCSANTVAQMNIAHESAKMQMAYKNPPSLSFNVKYTYALETAPAAIIDSTFGSFKMSGSFYWGIIDSTEFMQNNSYAITLYKPDKLMRVSNPSYIYPEIANFSSFDSIIGKNNYTTSCTNSGCNKVIALVFNDVNFPYKNFSVTYDSVTNFVTQIIYVIREDFEDYGDSYNRTAEGSSVAEYIIVKATYTNYQTLSFSNTFFNTGNYFILNGGIYTPQPPYSDYEVFIASSNLLN
jgi:hypothetical protein